MLSGLQLIIFYNQLKCSCRSKEIPTEPSFVKCIVQASPLWQDISSDVRWMIIPGEGKLQIGDTVHIEVSTCSDKINPKTKHSLFGKCNLVDVHNFWGKYAIVSMVTVCQSPCTEGYEPVYHMFWIESNCLELPVQKQRAAYHERLYRPFTILHVM